MIKICISGGACGGKSAIMGMLRERLPARFPGRRIFTIPETATELMGTGIDRSVVSNLRIESIMFDLQLEKERQIFAVAAEIPGSLVFLDRCLLDIMAYIGSEAYGELIRSRGFGAVGEIIARYDAILHLVSSALGEGYNLDNPQRFEDRDEARALEARTLAANRLHPCLRVVGNRPDFGEKVERAFAEIEDIIEGAGDRWARP
ncbi:MAG: ATP-binding protein [Succinivibrionaceae bacterium]|nr:ATP-binding protein [Succinivibrionaceae bacterium]